MPNPRPVGELSDHTRSRLEQAFREAVRHAIIGAYVNVPEGYFVQNDMDLRALARQAIIKELDQLHYQAFPASIPETGSRE